MQFKKMTFKSTKNFSCGIFSLLICFLGNFFKHLYKQFGYFHCFCIANSLSGNFFKYLLKQLVYSISFQVNKNREQFHLIKHVKIDTRNLSVKKFCIFSGIACNILLMTNNLFVYGYNCFYNTTSQIRTVHCTHSEFEDVPQDLDVTIEVIPNCS